MQTTALGMLPVSTGGPSRAWLGTNWHVSLTNGSTHPFFQFLVVVLNLSLVNENICLYLGNRNARLGSIMKAWTTLATYCKG